MDVVIYIQLILVVRGHGQAFVLIIQGLVKCLQSCLFSAPLHMLDQLRELPGRQHQEERRQEERRQDLLCHHENPQKEAENYMHK